MARSVLTSSGGAGISKKKQVREKRATKMLGGFSQTLVPPVLAFIIGLAVWQFGVMLLDIPPYIMPTPVHVVDAGIENWTSLSTALLSTVTSSIIGFIASVVFGIGAAVLMASSKMIERGVYPYAVILQTIPVVAIAPIIVIWFGSGFNAIVIISFLIAFFPMVSNTLIGLNATDRNMKDMFHLYHSSSWQMMWKLRFPAALPYIIAGMKISCTLAVVGAIVGEYIAGVGGGAGGLGYAITVASTRLQTPYLFTLGLSAAVFGVLFFIFVSTLSRLLLKSWHESEIRS